MSDQADQLRELVRTAASPVTGVGAPIVVVCGGRAGVGSTTLALDLAKALAAGKRRVVLVDADVERADATRRAGVDRVADGYLTDVLVGRRTALEVLENGPAGVRMLPARPHQLPPATISAGTRSRIPHELQRIGQRCDLVLVDTRGGHAPWSALFWQTAQLVLAVTTPDDAAVNDTFTMLNSASQGGPLPAVRMVVNRCHSPQQADQVHQQIAEACFRLLGELVPAMPPLPSFDTQLDWLPRPHPNAPVDSPYTHAIYQLAERLLEETNVFGRVA